MTPRDEEYLRRAMRLAMNGRGTTEPNPSVGCAIVKDDRIIGEGFTQPFGGPHAEPTALANCAESPAGATAYVSLEPCCHTNKRTPPCTPRLIEAKIARVVVGCLDPNPDVNGKGIEMLRNAGIAVDRAPAQIEAEAKQLIAPFIGRTQFRRPYVTLKWAQTADGKVAGAGGARLQISNPRSWRVVHELRSRSDAILVGINTVLSDDPMLTARDVKSSRLGVRIVLDSNLRIPTDSRLAQTAREIPVDVYFTRQGFISAGPQRIKELMSLGVNLTAAEEWPEGTIAIPKLLHREAFEDVTHLLVEPGPCLARSFFDAGAADRVWVIQSSSIRAPDGLEAPSVPSRYVKSGSIELDRDVLTEYLDPESDLFFAASESPDLVVVQSG